MHWDTKTIHVTLLQYSLYCSGLELNPQYLEVCLNNNNKRDPKDVHTLIPGICDYATEHDNVLCNYIYYANVIKITGLKTERLSQIIQGNSI